MEKSSGSGEMWKPNNDLLNQTVNILKALRDPMRSDHLSAMQTLDSAVSNSDFVLHILHLFSRGGSDEGQMLPFDLRQLGGLIIKNYAISHL
eukprot:gene58427-77954_t